MDTEKAERIKARIEKERPERWGIDSGESGERASDDIGGIYTGEVHEIDSGRVNEKYYYQVDVMHDTEVDGEISGKWIRGEKWISEEMMIWIPVG